MVSEKGLLLFWSLYLRLLKVKAKSYNSNPTSRECSTPLQFIWYLGSIKLKLITKPLLTVCLAGGLDLSHFLNINQKVILANSQNIIKTNRNISIIIMVKIILVFIVKNSLIQYFTFHFKIYV